MSADLQIIRKYWLLVVQDIDGLLFNTLLRLVGILMLLFLNELKLIYLNPDHLFDSLVLFICPFR
jgi:hypothetical protein